MARLDTLAPELLDGIFSFLSLSELKILRQACRRLAEQSIRRLFRRVRMSFLKKDREAFLGISNCQHLAPFVEELVWYECNMSFGEEGKAFMRNEWKSDLGLDYDVVAAFREALWVPVSVAEGEANDDEKMAWFDGSVSEVFAALSAMPRITTLITREIAAERILLTTPGGYPITHSLVKHFSDGVRDSGLTALLLSLSKKRICLKSLSLYSVATSFFLQDHRPDELSSAFGSLRHMDLCIDVLAILPEATGTSLAACIEAAPELRSLKLCFESMIDGASKYWGVVDVLRGVSLACLFELTLVDVWFSLVDLIDFIKRHAKTLHKLSLRECNLYRESLTSPDASSSTGNWAELLRRLAAVTDLSLQSLVISPSENRSASDDDEKHAIVGEEELLLYINKQGPNPIKLQWVDQVKTHSFRFDHDAWPEIAYFDKYKEHSTSDDWQAPLDRSFSGVEDGSGAATDCDSSSDYVSDDEETNCSYDSRPANRWTPPGPNTSWVFRFINGSIVFWSTAEDDENGYGTEIWKFTSRDGSCAFGDDPFDFFDDWDDSAGDIATPTALGEALEDFYDTHYHEDVMEGPFDVPDHARIFVNDGDNWHLARPFREYEAECAAQGKLPGCLNFDTKIKTDVEHDRETVLRAQDLVFQKQALLARNAELVLKNQELRATNERLVKDNVELVETRNKNKVLAKERLEQKITIERLQKQIKELKGKLQLAREVLLNNGDEEGLDSLGD